MITKRYPITCSLGVATLAKDESAKDLLLRTDKLLFQAKAQGKALIVSERNHVISPANRV